MACGCSKGRGSAGGTAAGSGTYRVIVNGHQVYESTNKGAVDTVARRFTDQGTEVTILAPGQAAPTT